MSVIENKNLSELLSVIEQTAGENQTLFDFLVREFNFCFRPTMAGGVGYDAQYMEATDDSIRDGRLAVSCIARCNWDCCAICSSKDFHSDWKKYGWSREFPALAALKMHRRILNESRPYAWTDIDPNTVNEIQRDPIAIKYIARRWWRANIHRIRKTSRYAMSETIYQTGRIKRSLKMYVDDTGQRGFSDKWRSVLFPLLIAKEDIIMTGGLPHLLNILRIVMDSVDSPSRTRPHGTTVKSAIIEYIDTHPKCKATEVAEACGTSVSYVSKVKKSLKISGVDNG